MFSVKGQDHFGQILSHWYYNNLNSMQDQMEYNNSETLLTKVGATRKATLRESLGDVLNGFEGAYL